MCFSYYLLPNLALSPPTTRPKVALLTPHTGGSGSDSIKAGVAFLDTADAAVVVVVVMVAEERRCNDAVNILERGQHTCGRIILVITTILMEIGAN